MTFCSPSSIRRSARRGGGIFGYRSRPALLGFLDGELTTYEMAMPFDDKMTATATFKVTGDLSVGST
jgi:hypothetical protein